MSARGRAGAIGYRRRSSPLHAAHGTVAAGYGCALAASALIVEHPLLLAALLVAVLAAGFGAGVGRQLVRALRSLVLPLAVITVLVNVLVSRQGLTVFVRLGNWGPLGQENLTLEAVVYGFVFALRIAVVTLSCLLVVCAADPDQLFDAFRGLTPRSALTAALATRLLPVLLTDSRRLADAQRCRADAQQGQARSRRRSRSAQSVSARLAILRAAVSGALERSLDLAAVLEMRGYGSDTPAPGSGGAFALRTAPRGGSRTRSAWRRLALASRHDLAFGLASLCLIALALAAALAGAAPFRAYPLLDASNTQLAALLALAFVVLALAPFADRRGIER